MTPNTETETDAMFPITIFPKQVREIKGLCFKIMCLRQDFEDGGDIADLLKQVVFEAAVVSHSITNYKNIASDMAAEGQGGAVHA